MRFGYVKNLKCKEERKCKEVKTLEKLWKNINSMFPYLLKNASQEHLPPYFSSEPLSSMLNIS